MNSGFRRTSASAGTPRNSAWELTDYAQAYADPATLERIGKDVADGEALGVSGTPTFFLKGRSSSRSRCRIWSRVSMPLSGSAEPRDGCGPFPRLLPWLLLLGGLVGLTASAVLTVEKIAILRDPAYVRPAASTRCCPAVR